MGKTLLKMQMFITIMVLGWRETMKEGRKQESSFSGNMVQVFGFKNNFSREAGCYGISRNFLGPPKWCEKSNSNFWKRQLWNAIHGWEGKEECVFHLATICKIASVIGGSVKTTEIPAVLWRQGVEQSRPYHLSCYRASWLGTSSKL